MAKMTLCDGDLLEQEVDVIVNSWNRNMIPWWLLVLQGVAGAIRKRAGYAPFRELARMGPIPLGGAVITGAGKLACKAIIHVAGINLLWLSSEKAVRECTKNALAIATDHGYRSIAFPLIGAGTGGGSPDQVLRFMQEEIDRTAYEGEVRIVRFGRR